MSKIQKKAKIRSVLLGLLVLVLVGAGIGIYIKLNWQEFDFRYAGTLEATRVDVSARIPSTVKDILVREGEHVKQSQELVSLSCEDIQISANLANQTYERASKLLRLGTMTQEMFDPIASRKEEAELKSSWCKISSPMDGVIMNRFFEPGEWVSPGMKILSLANVKDIWTYIYVPQNEVYKLKVGQKVTGVVPEIAKREFVGVVSKINDEAEFTPKNVQTRFERTRLIYGVKINFFASNTDEILKPGMTIEVSLPKD